MCELCESMGIKHQSKNQVNKESPVLTALPRWTEEMIRFNEFLASCGIDKKIDEFALMFTDPTELGEFINAAIREDGVEMFNAAEDEVETRPLLTKYKVQYFFLRMPSPMRAELMIVERGFSPVHTAHAHGIPVDPDAAYKARAVHLSFKVDNPVEYGVVMDKLRLAGTEMVQECFSSYGMFSYHRVNGLSQGLYLKPRCNMRDFVEKDRGTFGMATIGRKIKDAPQA